MKMRSAVMKAQLMAPTMCSLQTVPYSVQSSQSQNHLNMPACPFMIRKEGSDVCDWALRRLSRTGCCCWRRL